MVERTLEPKHTFSVQLPAFLYRKALDRAGKRGIGAFVRELVVKELADDNEQKFQQQLIADYKSVAQSQARKKEDELWDETTDDGL